MRAIVPRVFLLLAACMISAWILAENATQLPAASRIWQIAADAEDAQVTARDGVILRGACFLPKTGTPMKGAVLALHGVGDHGYSMAGLARMLSEQGYIVLTPDSRAHGGSGGDRITYGLVERHDVTAWLDWLEARFHPKAFYGYGASLGGAIILQSLAVEPRWRAVIAECPFASFHAVAYDRLHGILPVPAFAFAPVVEPALLYVRLRYGYDLRGASAEDALRASRTPTLLMHGADDRNIPIEHSRQLLAANPQVAQLWEVPNAPHVGIWNTVGVEYDRRVIDWFQRH